MAARALLTFRLDSERRQRLRARLASDGRTLSEIVTRELLEYVERAGRSIGSSGSGGSGDQDSGEGRAPRLADLALPEHLAARLRELRAVGASEKLSAALAALHSSGWPLPALARALGVSKQAVQARIRRSAAAAEDAGRGWLPPPSFPRRRPAAADGRRPHLTIKIDGALRAAAHRAAAHEGSSLSQVVERILDRYLRHDQPAGESSGPAGDAAEPARDS